MAAAVNSVNNAATTIAVTATGATSKVVDTVVGINLPKVEQYVYCAECCTVNAVSFQYPECIGYSMEGIICCCIGVRADGCKPVQGSDVVFLCNNETVMCIKPGSTICKAKQQCFCFENRCAYPCDSEVPCSCTICCVELFRSNQCTTSIKPAINILPRTSATFTAPTLPTMNR